MKRIRSYQRNSKGWIRIRTRRKYFESREGQKYLLSSFRYSISKEKLK